MGLLLCFELEISLFFSFVWSLAAWVTCREIINYKKDAKNTTMVCSAEDLILWSDFPRGLKVLLLDEDANSAAQTQLMLEAMDYLGT